MLTRSQINYSNIGIKDFYSFHKAPKVIHSKKKEVVVDNANEIETLLLFDIESYELKIKDGQSPKWIPHQISWGIYQYNQETETLELHKKRNYYVSEIWVHPKFRSQIQTKFKQSYKRHLSNVTDTAYPLKPAYQVITQMLKDIERFQVSTLASYNIYGDFNALNNLVEYIPMTKNISEKVFNHKYSNPFRNPLLRYCDIMHNVSILYMDYLIQEGFKDEKIFRNAATKHIKLRGRNNSKSIYSAEYIIHKFFGKKQTHFADDDVDLEAEMLEKIIKDKGTNALEYNVMYPTKLYNRFSQEILEKHPLKIQTAYLYSKTNTTNTTNTTNSRSDSK